MTQQAENVDSGQLPKAGHDLSLWCAVLGAPVLFLCHQLVCYMLVPWVCMTGKRPVLYLVSAGFLVATIIGGLLAWREFRHAGSGLPGSKTDPPLGRSQMLSVLGMMSSGLFSLAIVAQAIASFMVDPCTN